MLRPWVSLLVLLAAAGAADAQKPRPEWLGKEPLIIVGNWDSMPIFRRRVGGAASGRRRSTSASTPRRRSEAEGLGVTMGVIHFYKGYGLEAEAPQIDEARKLAELLPANTGCRVGVYVGSTIAYETFLAEAQGVTTGSCRRTWAGRSSMAIRRFASGSTSCTRGTANT